MSVHDHRRGAPRQVSTAVITVSDTRTPETDTGGDLAASLLADAGHAVTLREIVPDDVPAIAAAVRMACARDDTQAVIVTGGTGIAPRDVSPEAVEALLTRMIPGFGELFRTLSYEEIGSAAILSRAFAGLRGETLVAVLPGSRGAVRLALEKLLLPELGHLVAEAGKTR